MRTKILNSAEIKAVVRRMAYEVFERNYGKQDIVFIGISERGTYLAAMICAELEQISPIRGSVHSAEIAREQKGLMAMALPVPVENIQNQVLIVIDDVLYSGRTMLSVVAQLLTAQPQTIQTLVLVDRGHRQMPISPDYVGMTLATTWEQLVRFEVGQETSVWLE